VPKTSLTRTAISIEHWLVTDGHTDTGPQHILHYHSVAQVKSKMTSVSASKTEVNDFQLLYCK